MAPPPTGDPCRWTLDQLRSHQLNQFRNLVAHASQHSPFWADRLGGLDPDSVTLDHVGELPVLTKDELIESWDDIVTVPRFTLTDVQERLEQLGERSELVDGHIVVTTGGTSGVAAAVPYTPEVFDQVTMAMALRAAILISERQGRPFEMAERIVMIGSVSSRYMGHIILERAGWVNLPATTPLDELVTQLNDLQPDSLSAYASVLVRLAHEQLAGRLRLDLGNLGSSSETLSPDDQELCISAFGVPVRNSYAISELGFVASTIGEDTFLVNEDHFLLEPLDPNLESSAAGQLSDSLAVTSLTNLAFPLIRYQLSDRVAVEPQPWPEYPMAGIRRIAGRTGDWLRIGETEVHPSAISAPLIAHPGVGLWQVQQLPDRLRIQVVATGQEQIDTDQLAAEIGNRLARTDAFAQVAVDVVDEIPTQGHAAKHRSFIPLADG